MRPPLPKEHGAWAQLAIASGAVILVTRAHPLGFWAWLAALWAAFIAHEPLLLLLGQRGAKAGKEQGLQARLWLLLLASLALGLGWSGMRGAAPAARWALLVPLGSAGLLLPGILRGEEKSLAGEVLAALALGGAALPLSSRAGAGWTTAWQLAAGLMLAFVLATMLVRRFLAALRKRPEPLSAVGAALLTGLSAGLGLALAMEGGILEGLALLPLPLLGFRLLASPWPPHRLKRLGWLLAFGNVATALMLVAALR